MQTTFRKFLQFVLTTALLLTPVSAMADTLYLKDGRVLEGTVEREEEGFVFFVIEVGGIRDSRLFPREEILRIERDKDTPGANTPAKPETKPGSDPSARQKAIDAGAIKIAFITLGDPPNDMVGPFMNADALEESIELLEDDEPDIVVLWINSGGGALFEVQPLSDVIEKTIKPKYRVVAWIESAISAAAMTATTCEEMYFMSRGNYGAAVAFSQEGGTLASVQGEELEQILRFGEELSRRGNRDPLILKAMQKRMPLSCDIDANGVVTWREDTSGEYVVSPATQILTLNAVDAQKYRVSGGIADTKDELAKLLGAPEWVEVGQDANDYQVEFRENVAKANVEVGKLMAQMQIALQNGQAARARRYLGEMRSWARRAPSLVTYGAGGVPPLTPEFFRELERQINNGGRR